MFDVSLCVAPFILYQQRAVGVDLEMIGKMTAWAGLLSMALLYPAGVLSDRVHPLRVMLAAVGLMALLSPLGLVWLFIEPTPKLALRLTVAQVFISLPLAVLYKASILPMYMRLLPKERYGQFGSADAMVRSLSVVIAGPIVGLMMDALKWRYDGDPYYYRYAPAWTIVVLAFSMFFLWRVYAYWKRHGGDTHFEPPSTGPVVQALQPDSAHATAAVK
jgi:MFS family permease